jgi:hypothetical protein
MRRGKDLTKRSIETEGEPGQGILHNGVEAQLGAADTEFRMVETVNIVTRQTPLHNQEWLLLPKPIM